MCGFYSRCFVQESRIERSIWEKPWSVKFRYRAAYCVLFFSNGQNFQGRCSLEYNVKFLARWRVGEFLFFKKKIAVCWRTLLRWYFESNWPKKQWNGSRQSCGLVVENTCDWASPAIHLCKFKKLYFISVRVHWNKIILILMLTFASFQIRWSSCCGLFFLWIRSIRKLTVLFLDF